MADQATKTKNPARTTVAQQAAPVVPVKNYQDRNLISKMWYGLHKVVDTSNLVLDRTYDLVEVSSDYAVTEINNLKTEAS